jgi:6-pyruvoyltetrahydropterin/6-carboxytetrahydropterin synthase
MSKVTICRKVSFSSGHRYFIPDYGEEANREIYGSRFSTAGHGHNFVLEAYLEGEVDPLTGMVVNLKDVDRLVKEVVEPLDHHYLNGDIPFFQEVVPTAENIALYCFRQIRGRLKSESIRLKGVRLYEGSELWVDCGEG